MESHVVRKQIQIKATPEKVWDALTDPEKTKKYFFHCKVISDWRRGSTIVFKGRLFLIIKVELKGEILEITPGKLLKYTLKNNGSSETSFSTVTDELSYANGITTLSVTDDVGTGEGAAKRYKRSQKGWDKVLKGLKELVETGR